MFSYGDVAMQESLADPSGSSAIGSAVFWAQGALLGSVALAVAVVAVASVGLLMLGGRIEVRRGLTMIAGCFVLFGAPAIANGLETLLMREPGSSAAAQQAPPPVPPAPVMPPAPPTSADPYAGASVPAR
jgi:type IV secretory pathway VirB2 component (pilin)